MARRINTGMTISGALAAVILAFGSNSAVAQDADDFDVSVSTRVASGLICGQSLNFGRIYIGPSNALSTITLTSGASLTSNHATVAVAGGVIGLCVITGFQGADTATVILTGGGGSAANGGLTGITLSDGASHTLTATVQLGASGSLISGGRSGLTNAIVPFFGTVTIPASHTNFGSYTATLTATAVLN